MTYEAIYPRILAVALGASLLAAGCAGLTTDGALEPGPSTGPSSSPSVESPEGPAFEAPPPVTLRYLGERIELEPWAYCYDFGCADGFPPSPPPDVGEPEEVIVEFPLTGWSFTASFTPAGEKCGRVQGIPLEEREEGTYLLRPAGYAGTYDVMLFGQGNGDLAVTFRWTTPDDGPLPVPQARLAVLSDNDGRVDSYGVELSVSNLARTPTEPSATITVRAHGGEAMTFEPRRVRIPCLPEGSVYWRASDRIGRDAAALGEPPFTYEVVLVLDGVRYAATATWPVDVIPEEEPSVALRFRPDLPALS